MGVSEGGRVDKGKNECGVQLMQSAQEIAIQ